MRLLTIADIQALEPGEIVPSFRAQLKEVRKYSSGDGEHGPYTLQNLVMMDSTGVMKVLAKNKEEFVASEIGSWFLFECVNGNHGLTGIKIGEDTYQGKTSKIISITKTCNVLDGGERPKDTASEPGAMIVQQGTSKPRVIQPAALPDTAQAIQDVRERLGKAANGLIMAYDAAVYVMNSVQAKHTEVVFTPDVLEKIAVHLSIGLEKGGSVHGLPTGPLNKLKKKEPEPEPEQPHDPDEPPF